MNRLSVDMNSSAGTVTMATRLFHVVCFCECNILDAKSKEGDGNFTQVTTAWNGRHGNPTNTTGVVC